MIFSRLNGSTTPERLTTERLAVSIVVNLRPHSGHWRRRRIDAPSSEVLESTTRESPCLQNGQCTPPPRRRAAALADRYGAPRERPCNICEKPRPTGASAQTPGSPTGRWGRPRDQRGSVLVGRDDELLARDERRARQLVERHELVDDVAHVCPGS